MTERSEGTVGLNRLLGRWLHALAHRLGWNEGVVETRWTSDGVLIVGFRCEGCGELQDEHVAPSYLQMPRLKP